MLQGKSHAAVLCHLCAQSKQPAPLHCLLHLSAASTDAAAHSEADSVALPQHAEPALSVPSFFSSPCSTQDGSTCADAAVEHQRPLCELGWGAHCRIHLSTSAVSELRR